MFSEEERELIQKWYNDYVRHLIKALDDYDKADVKFVVSGEQ